MITAIIMHSYGNYEIRINFRNYSNPHRLQRLQPPHARHDNHNNPRFSICRKASHPKGTRP